MSYLSASIVIFYIIHYSVLIQNRGNIPFIFIFSQFPWMVWQTCPQILSSISRRRGATFSRKISPFKYLFKVPFIQFPGRDNYNFPFTNGNTNAIQYRLISLIWKNPTICLTDILRTIETALIYSFILNQPRSVVY